MSKRDLEDALDPLLVARLAAWFGEGPLPPPDAGVIERESRREALEELEKVIDWDLHERLSAGPPSLLSWSSAPLEPSSLRPILKTSLPSGPLEQVWAEDYEQPIDVRDILVEDNTPQALLRDLYRPIHYFGDVAYRIQETGPATSDNASLLAREAMGTPRGLGRTIPAGELIAQDIGQLRAILAANWGDSALDPGATAGDDDLDDHHRWFGMEGGYDPDL